MKRRLFFAIFSLYFLVLPDVLFAQEDVRKLRVGVIQSLTGIAAEDGVTVQQALQLAAEKINRSSTPAVELRIEDDHSQPRDAVSAYQKLVSEKVDIIVGATWDFTTNAIIPLAARGEVPLFNTSTPIECLKMDQAAGKAFVNAPEALSEGRPFARFLTARGPKSMVTVYANNSWGETLRGIYESVARNAGVQILGSLKPVSYDENEWREMMPKLKRLSPDLVLLLLNKNDIKVFLTRAAEIGFSAALFTSQNGYHAARLYQPASLFEGACFSYPYERLTRQDGFAEEYRRRFGEAPRLFADNSYDALFLIHKGWQQAQRQKVGLIEALQGQHYKGVVGEYRYRGGRSFALGDLSLLCVKNGKVELLTER